MAKRDTVISGVGQVSVTGSCIQENKSSRFIKCGKLLNRLGGCCLKIRPLYYVKLQFDGCTNKTLYYVIFMH